MSYQTNSGADSYFAERYNSGAWDTVSEANKTKLLATATRIIDTLNFVDDKTDDAQINEFPRGGGTTVPDEIKVACCEIAFAILSGRDVEYEHELLGETTASTEIGRYVSDPATINLAKIHGVPSVIAWKLLRPFFRDGSVISLSRVS